MSKIRFLSLLAALLTLVGTILFGFANVGGELTSGFGIYEQMIVFWNQPHYLAFAFYAGIFLAILLLLLSIRYRFIGLIGSLYLGVIFIPLSLSYYGIEIPTLTPWVHSMMDRCTSTIVLGPFPLYIEFFTFNLGLGSLIIALAAILGIIGALLPKKLGKNEFKF